MAYNIVQAKIMAASISLLEFQISYSVISCEATEFHLTLIPALQKKTLRCINKLRPQTSCRDNLRKTRYIHSTQTVYSRIISTCFKKRTETIVIELTYTTKYHKKFFETTHTCKTPNIPEKRDLINYQLYLN